VFVDASVHVHADRSNLPAGSEEDENDPKTVNEWFSEYLGELGAFALEHENRHVHQLMAYPALYVRGLRESRWALTCLADFQERGDIPYDPTGQHRIVVDQSAPEVQFLIRNYQSTLTPYLAGTTSDGRLAWGDDPALPQLERTRSLSELTLIEAEALVVQYHVATRSGFSGTFRSWARIHDANPTAVNDVVTVLAGTGDRRPVEEIVLSILPALVWHAFHTSWPMTAFFNFLEMLTGSGNVTALRGIAPDPAFALIGACRGDPTFLGNCPTLDHDGIVLTATSRMPVNEPFVQFEEDDRLWEALAEADPSYPLADAVRFRVGQRWPDPMEFVDPSADTLRRMQIDYPPSAYIVRVTPGVGGERGFYRRWIPRTPWRQTDAASLAGHLTVLEIAQTVMANVYMAVVPPDAYHSGDVLPTCWHETCPVYPTGLCRFWDAIPSAHDDCEFLQAMPAALHHVIDSAGPNPTLRKTATPGGTNA
jgi:hypothetical protein